NNYYYFTDPVYELVKLTLETNQDRDDIINTVLSFAQDIPYGIPPITNHKNNKYIWGVLSAPQIFNEKWGDCDSKALMAASALKHWNFKIIAIHVPDHLFLGIQGIPKPYQSFVKYRGEKYIYCEPAGSGKLYFGQIYKVYKSILKTTLLKVKKPDPPLKKYKQRMTDIKAKYLYKQKRNIKFNWSVFNKKDTDVVQKYEYKDRTKKHSFIPVFIIFFTLFFYILMLRKFSS
ncbi:MAG: hypothetical protein KKH98_04830, partial [Spirochaetes bacterium]|nr:hypothetical protein [Spirochaetota bacterium]